MQGYQSLTTSSGVGGFSTLTPTQPEATRSKHPKYKTFILVSRAEKTKHPTVRVLYRQHCCLHSFSPPRGHTYAEKELFERGPPVTMPRSELSKVGYVASEVYASVVDLGNTSKVLTITFGSDLSTSLRGARLFWCSKRGHELPLPPKARSPILLVLTSPTRSCLQAKEALAHWLVLVSSSTCSAQHLPADNAGRLHTQAKTSPCLAQFVRQQSSAFSAGFAPFKAPLTAVQQGKYLPKWSSSSPSNACSCRRYSNLLPVFPVPAERELGKPRSQVSSSLRRRPVRTLTERQVAYLVTAAVPHREKS